MLKQSLKMLFIFSSLKYIFIHSVLKHLSDNMLCTLLTFSTNKKCNSICIRLLMTNDNLQLMAAPDANRAQKIVSLSVSSNMNGSYNKERYLIYQTLQFTRDTPKFGLPSGGAVRKARTSAIQTNSVTAFGFESALVKCGCQKVRNLSENFKSI